jgi:hypothetical protein
MERVYALSANIDGSIFSPADNFKNIGSLVTTIVMNATVLAGILALIIIIVGGFGIIMGAGAGDPKKMQSGTKMLTSAIVGLLIVVFALWFVQGLSILIGVNPLNPFTKSVPPSDGRIQRTAQ